MTTKNDSIVEYYDFVHIFHFKIFLTSLDSMCTVFFFFFILDLSH